VNVHRSGLPVLVPAVLLAVLLQGGHPAEVRAADPACSASVASSSVVVLDCRPGFATDHDRITIYPRAGTRPDVPAAQQVDTSNAVWLFQPGAGDRVSLLVDFHPDELGRPVADLYDDGNGDGRVDTIMAGGLPAPVEHSGRWTVRVTSLDGAWTHGGRTSFNLDVQVDGPVRASFNSDAYVGLLQNDGQPDFTIRVRDTDADGRPDFEWRQFRPPLPEDPSLSGYYRTEIMANPQDDELPITGNLIWPFLAASPQQYRQGEFVKAYGQSLAPIEVDWERARIVQIGEFVASRGNPGSYFIYSIQRVVEGTTSATNFENPFAFYDLAGRADGWPDMTIRFETTLPFEIPELRNRTPIDIVEYTWDQEHDHTWSYALNLVGHQPIDTTIQFPDFAVRAIPPALLPRWVVDHPWDAATFVQVTIPYWTTEHIYDYTVEQGQKVLPLRYLPGVDPQPPVAAFSTIPEGFRGEYAFHLTGQARLYLSPVDGRLHLFEAEGGVWNLGAGEELRSESRGGRYVDGWTLVRDGLPVAELHTLAGQAVLSTSDGLLLAASRTLAEPGLLEPPTDSASWARLGAIVTASPPSGAADDLRAMFDRVALAPITLRGARASDVSLTDDGFQFVLTLSGTGSGAPWLAGLPAGRYLAEYHRGSGYSARPIRPASVSLDAPAVQSGAARALETARLAITVRNAGDEGVTGVKVVLNAGPLGEALRPVGSAVVDVPGGGSTVAGFSWAPPAGGDWQVQAELPGTGVVGPAAVLQVAPPPVAGLPEVLAGQGLDGWGLAPALLLLALGALLVGWLSTGLWNPRGRGRGPSATGAPSSRPGDDRRR
jgi:hypothetical protein